MLGSVIYVVAKVCKDQSIDCILFPIKDHIILTAWVSMVCIKAKINTIPSHNISYRIGTKFVWLLTVTRIP